MPGIEEAKALQMIHVLKQSYDNYRNEEDGVRYLRLQMDDFVIAEFSDLKDGVFTHFSTTIPNKGLDALLGADAAILKKISPAPDWKTRNLHCIDKGVRLPGADHGKIGINQNEADFIAKFVEFSKEMKGKNKNLDTDIQITLNEITATCSHESDVFNNIKTPEARAFIKEAIDDLVKVVDNTPANDANYAKSQTYVKNLRVLKGSIRD